MPTLWSQSLIPTLREVPAEAEVPSHQLMLRAGLIRKLGAGVYDYLPLGLRSLRKAMEIVRQEMNNAGAIEVFLPTLQPIELWERTGRRKAYGDNLFVVKDRHGRVQALGPTHEEVVTELVGAYVDSYRQLPLTLYQIQTKFRDEFRPRFGVLRSREFQMKDAYSFHTHVEGPGGLNETYDKQFAAYCRIFERCGIPYRVVEAESGPIGGSASHEFMVPSPTGEDRILESDACDANGNPNYAANIEKCETAPRKSNLDAPAKLPLERVHTPHAPGIEEVCKQLHARSTDMLKTLVYEANIEPPDKVALEHKAEASGEPDPRAFVSERFFVLAVVRGDHEVNEGKLRQAVRQINPHIMTVELMEPRDALRHEFIIGYVGPHAANASPLTRIIADPDAVQDHDWITGANEVDHHVRHFNWSRDTADSGGVIIADIRNAEEGDLSPKNDGGVLHVRKGIEIGHVFKLGTKYTKAMGVSVLTEKNERAPMIMGCYGIGINRILASAIERDLAGKKGHDENGIIWPAAIAPYQVVITPIKYDGAVKETAEKLAAAIEAGGADVLIDNRDERPGVKFKDADLIGFPVRITIGDKGLANGQVEVKARNAPTGSKAELVAVDAAAAKVLEMLKTL